MSDLVERLRDKGRGGGGDAFEAAREIEILREAIKMLREANRVLLTEKEGLRHEVSVLHAMLKDYERVYGTYGEER